MTIKKQNFKKNIKNILPVAAVLAAILTCLTCALATSPNNNSSRVDASASSAQPGAFLELNYQNFTVLTDTENDWYTSARPTQKGLYQIAAEYIDGEGVSFRYNKNNRTPDPMIYLPVYDICYNINIKEYPYFAVCYKSTATNQNGVCYFATSANAGLGEGKNFGINMAPSNDWTIAVAQAGKNNNWTGRLTELRFDISSGEFSGQYTVKWIGLFKSESDARAFGVNGVTTKYTVTPDKTVFDRGEDITFSVSGAGKGDWAVLVQKGDACYAPSVNTPDLYVSTCRPLYCADIDNGRATFNMETSDGIYKNTLLPAGEYDIVVMPRGRYVETGRATITLSDVVAREPVVTEKIYVTRGPDPTEKPEITEEPTDEETPIPTATDGRHRITVPPTEVPKDSSGGKTGAVIAITAILCCAACLVIFFILRGKRLRKTAGNGNGGNSGNGSSNSSGKNGGNGENPAGGENPSNSEK